MVNFQPFETTLAMHRTMLNDTHAQHAYAGAIANTVREGDVVVDVGTGTGIHALFAARAGAKKVYAIESSPIAGIAQQVFAASPFADRIELVYGDANQVELPSPADVLVAHISFEHYFRTLHRVARHLRPGGVMIPRGVELFAAPIECPSVYSRLVERWAAAFGGAIEARRFAAGRTYRAPLAHDEFRPLAAAQRVCRLEFGSAPSFDVRHTFSIVESGALHGVALWYVLRLDERHTIDTTPPHALPAPPWNQHLRPMVTPVSVEANTQLSVRFCLDAEARFGVEVDRV